LVHSNIWRLTLQSRGRAPASRVTPLISNVRRLMRLSSEVGQIEIVNEPTYTFGSADNIRRYPFAVNLSSDGRLAAIHGVLVDGEPVAVFSDYRCSGVHQHSAILHRGKVLLAVGGQVVCFRPKPFQFEWQLEIDRAACFGLHFQPSRQALVSHGELEIARFTDDGRILWASSGADIFSEGFRLHPNYIEAVDFNENVYHFSYLTGATGA